MPTALLPPATVHWHTASPALPPPPLSSLRHFVLPSTCRPPRTCFLTTPCAALSHQPLCHCYLRATDRVDSGCDHTIPPTHTAYHYTCALHRSTTNTDSVQVVGSALPLLRHFTPTYVGRCVTWLDSTPTVIRWPYDRYRFISICPVCLLNFLERLIPIYCSLPLAYVTVSNFTTVLALTSVPFYRSRYLPFTAVISHSPLTLPTSPFSLCGWFTPLRVLLPCCDTLSDVSTWVNYLPLVHYRFRYVWCCLSNCCLRTVYQLRRSRSIFVMPFCSLGTLRRYLLLQFWI